MTDTLFPELTATAAADAAIEQVERHADEEWKDIAYATVCHVAQRLAHFTTDDVKAALPADATTHEPRAWGAIMRRAARDGVCRATDGWRTSDNPVCHARPMRVWASLLWGGF
jgi:hypothetical protein